VGGSARWLVDGWRVAVRLAAVCGDWILWSFVVIGYGQRRLKAGNKGS